MNYEQIETFLAVVSYGTVSGAAESLYVSQSTVSARLQQLEDELGVKLLLREKGHRSIELTERGRSFVSLANQWEALYKETRAVSVSQEIRKLSIASVDAVNNYTLTGLFRRYIDHHPDIRLEINTHHSNEIHRLVENRSSDIGFVFSAVNYPDLISVPVYRELMYLMCHKDSRYRDGISCSELNVADEIYLNWGPDYQRWHDARWSPSSLPLITVNTGSMLQNYLNIPGRWAVAPMSVISALRDRENIRFCRIKDGPAPRICYMLKNRYPNYNRADTIREFEEELEQFISEEESICTYEEWMNPEKV